MYSVKQLSTQVRVQILVRGIVQGVGFRPFVFTLARRHALKGQVLNNTSGVLIDVEGEGGDVEGFIHDINANPPPLSLVESIERTDDLASAHYTDFRIIESASDGDHLTPIPADIATCADCLRELFDSHDRRYRYPFINCTNCGPRFTITENIPYDRAQTTMRDFVMCDECRGEYRDPLDRRFHAEPNACAECGPHVEFRNKSEPPAVAGGGCESRKAEGGRMNERSNPNALLPPSAFRLPTFALAGGSDRQDAIRSAQASIARGEIVAVKGIGGFHLACDAANEGAVRRLRERKGRVDKPFAVMVRDINQIYEFADVSAAEITLLESRARPIVLLKKKPASELSKLIAPGNAYIGVMLPYTPLHHLLLTDTDDAASVVRVLVMTSGNFSNEPIITDTDDALRRLATLADAFLVHNRSIHIPCDDSVVRVFEGRELPIRRSRGYAPMPVKLPFKLKPTLAVGGELKSTFCLAKDDYAFMSQHIGDMESLETLRAFESSIELCEKLFRITPEIIACDMHPRYLSTRFAKSRAKSLLSTSPDNLAARRVEHRVEICEVQHHHAHIAAVMAENGLLGEQPVIAFSFDGTGYGTDAAIWGGEVLIADYKRFVRAAHLRYVPLVGGDAAVKRPYRHALAHLWAAGVEWDEALPSVAACPSVERGVIRRQLETGFGSVPTSSMGRLFDAVAALAGVRQIVTYEAQAAIEFEALAADDVSESYEFELVEGDAAEVDSIIIEPNTVIRHIAQDVLTKVPASIIAAKFHNAVAGLILKLSLMMRAQTNLTQVALSGGVFQNVALLEAATKGLRAANFEIFTHRLVPPNDGGLALGQAVIANFMKQETA
ncbi:MAG: carbamoyltransferase HypF [Pyrinomonadaceae bacterium MAG19_C2-C3]|nr:carbamoyltransferase HypF [Pyrinomonadaceae bacterium MAG19_C2-C3]